MRYLSILAVLLISAACNNGNNKPVESTQASSNISVDMHRLPELRTVDSIDMHFFNDINDQKTYKRYGLNDTAAIHMFTLTEINQAFVDKTSCEYDTKFFCFSKGQIVKTLYVAARQDSCHFIGYIKSGGIAVKAQLSDAAAAMVNGYRKKSAF